MLKDERPDAPRCRDDELETDDSNFDDPANDGVASPVGNFLKTDQSLVMRSMRLKRFSEKYRDSIVRRVLSGASTMAQIRQEKNISEGELTDWIADLFERMQARLDALEGALDAMPSIRLLGENPRVPPDKPIPTGPTVEGQVKPR